ncbi:protein yippee-like 2 isoform X1 [Meriones unguiculatus]|uniref:protein yippee-like 2 isoform X1 n=1 Tax=Meriones unguiculatus TaxID=10047 RepID=UPI00293E8907|nr:protein yippee-like 2 isoform X1 [Meriones unguiculatus]
MRSGGGGGGGGGGCGFKSTQGAPESAAPSFLAERSRAAEPGAGRTRQPASRLLRTSSRPLLESPSSDDGTSVWSLPHTHPLPNHGLYLCLSVFPVRPVLWERLVGRPRLHPTLSSTNGEDDEIQDFSGIPALVPPDLQLHSLQSSLGQS